MKRKEVNTGGNRSIKTFFLFCLVVLLLILGSFSIKLFFLFKDSSFDGKHRFTLEVRHSPREADILTFEPITGSIDIVNLSASKDAGSLADIYGVPVDGVIKDSGDRVTNKNLLNKLYKFMFRITSGEDVNSLDVFRLVLFSYGVERGQVGVEKVSDKEFISKNLIDETFLDHELVDENKTISIVNAAGQPGLAGRTERILNSLGANVVSVTTSPDIEDSSRIEYAGDVSYTLSRIQRFAKFPLKNVEEERLSDILIVLGEDSIKDPEE